MTTFAEGSLTNIAFKAETDWGVAAGATGAQLLRRVTANVGLAKNAVESQEKRPDFQTAVNRHGTRSASFSLSGELTGGTYAAFMAAALRKAWAAVADVDASVGDGFTISSGVLTRGGGDSESFVTDGLRAGMVIRLAGMAGSANNGRNFRVSAVTATTLALAAVDGAAIADDGGANTSATISVPGRVTWIPLTAHTNDSFTVEDHSTLRSGTADFSRYATGVTIGSLSIDSPPNSLVQVGFEGIGKDVIEVEGASAPYFTTPTAITASDAYEAALGALYFDGALAAQTTGLNLSLDLGLAAPTVRASTVPGVSYGRAATISGQISALVTSNDYFGLFSDETETSLHQVFEAPVASGARPFFSVYLPRVKVNGWSIDDADQGRVQQLDLVGLKAAAATGVEPTMILIQDSQISA